MSEAPRRSASQSVLTSHWEKGLSGGMGIVRIETCAVHLLAAMLCKRNSHPPVLLALLFDLRDAHAADLVRPMHVVPPQGCRSYPTISFSLTRPVPMGGLTDMVLTRPGAASSSASVIQRERTSAPAAIIAASFLVISSLSRPASGMSKSSRPSVSPTAPPVTG